MFGVCVTGWADPPIKVACIGDSITAGAYPGLLQTLLGAAYQVENDGVSGTTMLKQGDFSYWSVGKLPSVAAFQPDIVTIKLGTNDTKPQNWAAHGSDFKADALALIDWLQALASRPRIVLVRPVPSWANTLGISDVVMQDILGIIDAIALERNLPVIDAHTPFLASSALFPDGVHPNAEGAAAIAELFRQAILADQATPVVEFPAFSPVAGTFATAQMVTLSTPTEGGSIRFTTDGSPPTAGHGTPYRQPIPITVTTTLLAMASKSGLADSAVAAGTYTIRALPRVGLRNGSFEEGTNGWTVLAANASPPAYGVVTNQGHTDGGQALALGSVNNAGNAVFAQTLTTATGVTYTLQFDYGAFGLGARQQRLLVEVFEEGSVTTSLVATALGTGSFLPESTTFQERALAFVPHAASVEIRFTDQTTGVNSFSCDGMLDDILVDGGAAVAMPAFSQPAGTYAHPLIVGISAATDGASIRYTVDGTFPSAEDGLPYTGPIRLLSPATIRAVAFKTGLKDSGIVAAAYVLVDQGLIIMFR
ncbi:MAG: chitobiase/beta-hexosaminidase C-terminal domain-containing protein [Lentisphaerae bacterium]|nr:chitobiase/beta-hexosaminidase C-terminal domain-containing protein [Lentisphaerota bacterium]